MRAGIVRDLSVGFYGGQWLCSICGRDMQQWYGPESCPHLLGMTYTPRDEANSQKGQPQVAQATIEQAHLAEVSGVYDGATPGAMIAKARVLATEGQLSERRRELVEVRYHIHLPERDRRWAGTDTRGTQQQSKETGMADDETEQQPQAPAALGQQDTPTSVPDETADGAERAAPVTAPDAQLTAVRAALAEAGQAEAATVLAGVRALAAEVARLRPLADDGRQYRTDLMAEALREGARAHGADFATETYRGLLETAPLATIKRMRDDWAKAGDALFVGGRQTVEADQTAQGQNGQGNGALRELPVPTAAYRG
jgi:hypothetical protein